MATVPLSATNIRLMSGIPFSNDYKHTITFDDATNQYYWFKNQPATFEAWDMNFQRSEKGAYIKVPLPLDSLLLTNYMMFQNSAYGTRYFYAFVTHLEYVNKSVTHVYFQIDVIQTWMFAWQFQPSFVVREHRPQWNADGTPVINTIDEGLDYGKHYETTKVDRYQPYGDNLFLVIVAKQPFHDGAEQEIRPTINGAPQPLSYYVHPFKRDGTVPVIDYGTEGGLLNNPTDVLRALFKIEGAVNNIVSLYVTEHIGYNLPYDATNDMITFDSNMWTNVRVAEPPDLFLNTMYLKWMVDYGASGFTLPDKYYGFHAVEESKLLMYPYALTILDDFKGNRQVIKNEYVNDKAFGVNARGSLGTSHKVVYSMANYLIDNSLVPYDIANTITLENAVISNTPNDIPIMNDYLSAFLQGNKNQIENQKQSIVFNGVMDGLSGVMGTIGGAMAGGAMGGVGGAVAGGANGALSTVQGAGNSVLALQGIEAKQADINNIPPTISKMGGNTAFDYGNNINGLYIVKKQITAEYRKKLTDFFKMYGYKTNEVKIPNFKTRRSWNYVQTLDCNIVGNFNHEDLQEIKAVFDNGITLWHTADVGNYSLPNEEV
jgi:hypothetical protein